MRLLGASSCSTGCGRQASPLRTDIVRGGGQGGGEGGATTAGYHALGYGASSCGPGGVGGGTPVGIGSTMILVLGKTSVHTYCCTVRSVS